MDAIAQGMLEANEWENRYYPAIDVNSGALGLVARWRRSAKTLFGENHEVTQYYTSISRTLIKLREGIGEDNREIMKQADLYALDLNKQYGGIKKREEEISREDHLKRFKPDEFIPK